MLSDLGLANLLLVSVSPGFLEALVRYWVPMLSLFRFGCHEMTPTLEEYHFMLRMSPCLGNAACVLPDENARATFSSLVGIRRRFVIVEDIVGVLTIHSDFLFGFSPMVGLTI